LTGDTRLNTALACSSTISPNTAFGGGLALSAQCWFDRTISTWKSIYGRAHTPANEAMRIIHDSIYTPAVGGSILSAPTDHSGGAKNSNAMPSGSRKLRPDP
jgi:hypothetical protein